LGGESAFEIFFTMIRSTIEALRDRWANLRHWIRWVILILVLAGLGLFAVRPGYHLFKTWRVERNLASARKAVGEVRMNDARDLSLSVLQAGDPSIEAFRILEQSMGVLRDPRHADIARALMFHPESSDEDRLKGFRAIAPDMPLGMLGMIWSALPASSQQDPDLAAAFADRLLAEHRLNEVASVLLAVPEANRSRAVQQRLIRALIGSATREGYDEAQRMIAKDFSKVGTGIPEWLELLEQIPPVSLKGDLLDPVRKVLEDPAVGGNARCAMMLARMEYGTNFPGRAKVLEEVVARWQDGEPELLADFLGDLGFYQRLLEIFPVKRVEKNPGLFRPILVAMERSGAWEQIPRLLDAHGRLIPEFEQLGLRAVVAAKAGDAKGQAHEWNAALAEAKSSPLATALLDLSRMAEKEGMREASEEALLGAIQLKRGPLPLYANLKPLLNSLVSQEREGDLLDICLIYLSLEPGNPMLITQYVYLACLNNRIETATILKAMVPLVKAFPKEVPVQMVQAMACLCEGKAAAAAAVLDPLELDSAKLPPAYQAVYFACQVLNGRMDKDDERIRNFPLKLLLPSERKKFRELIRLSGP
jgi:hypothetical protein